MAYGTAAANQTSAPEAGADTGTKERAARAGGIEIAPRAVLDNTGISVSVGARATFECALDVMLGPLPAIGHLAGSQGAKQDRLNVARSRYEAGMKMRRLFMNAGLQGVKAHDLQGGPRGKAAHTPDEEEDARADFNKLMSRLGPKGEIAAGVCCYDKIPDNPRWQANVREALDALCLVVL